MADPNRTLFLALPADPAAAAAPWWLADAGRLVASGVDDGWRDLADQPAGPARLVALAPAALAPVRWLDFPDLTPPQAAAAAALAAADTSLAAPDDRHIAAAPPPAPGMAVPVASTSAAAVSGWLDWLAANGAPAAELVPLAACVPAALVGAHHARLGDQLVLRTDTLAAAADPAIDALLAGDDRVAVAADDAVLAALLAGAADAAPNLRSGRFAPPADWGMQPRERRWLIRLVAALVLVSVMVPVAGAVRLALATAAADRAAVAAAGAAGVRARDAAAAEAALDTRLAASAGGPISLSSPTAGLMAAMADQPGAAVRSFAYRADGTLSVTLAGPRIEDVNAVLTELQRRGFTVTAQPMAGSDGMQMGVVTIRALP